MKLDKKAESIASVLVAVIILSLALFGILSVLNFSRNVMFDFEGDTDAKILKKNAENIVNKLNLDQIKENETFYIYKDNTTNTYQIFTGSENKNYKYIDGKGDKIDPNTYEGKKYEREYVKKENIIKYSNTPSKIQNFTQSFDSMNFDGLNNSGVIDGSTMTGWLNLAGGVKLSMYGISPTYQKNIVGTKPLIKFGGNGKFILSSDINVNGNQDCGVTPKFFEQKSFLLFFRTGDNITDKQFIFKQGDDNTGYSLYINGGQLYANAYNNRNVTKYFCPVSNQISYEWTTGNKLKELYFGKIFPNSNYFVTIVHDSGVKDKDGLYLANQSSFKLYINGILKGKTDNIMPQVEHLNFSLGGNTDNNSNYFNGYIGEFNSWNYALSESEITGLNEYLNKKWLSNNSNLEYYLVETKIKKI